MRCENQQYERRRNENYAFLQEWTTPPRLELIGSEETRIWNVQLLERYKGHKGVKSPHGSILHYDRKRGFQPIREQRSSGCVEWRLTYYMVANWVRAVSAISVDVNPSKVMGSITKLRVQVSSKSIKRLRLATIGWSGRWERRRFGLTWRPKGSFGEVECEAAETGVTVAAGRLVWKFRPQRTRCTSNNLESISDSGIQRAEIKFERIR